MRRLRSGAVAALVFLGTTAAGAYADQTIYAGPPTQYIAGNITINQGEKVTFTNVDTVTHDVIAQNRGPDGKPLFASVHTDPGGSEPVTGTEYLTTGSYEYYCSIHPYMTGTITVSSGGTPTPRPGTGGGSGSGAGPGAQQAATSPPAAAPSVSIEVLDTKLAAVRQRGALQVSVTANQPATVGLVARAGGTRIASGTARLAQAGSKTVALKLSRSGKKRVKRSSALTVSVSARAAGSSTVTATADTTMKLR
jgi:plastocyanin